MQHERSAVSLHCFTGRMHSHRVVCSSEARTSGRESGFNDRLKLIHRLNRFASGGADCLCSGKVSVR